jgi:hypothetical protein
MVGGERNKIMDISRKRREFVGNWVRGVFLD